MILAPSLKPIGTTVYKLCATENRKRAIWAIFFSNPLTILTVFIQYALFWRFVCIKQSSYGAIDFVRFPLASRWRITQWLRNYCNDEKAIAFLGITAFTCCLWGYIEVQVKFKFPAKWKLMELKKVPAHTTCNSLSSVPEQFNSATIKVVEHKLVSKRSSPLN